MRLAHDVTSAAGPAAAGPAPGAGPLSTRRGSAARGREQGSRPADPRVVTSSQSACSAGKEFALLPSAAIPPHSAKNKNKKKGTKTILHPDMDFDTIHRSYADFPKFTGPRLCILRSIHFIAWVGSRLHAEHPITHRPPVALCRRSPNLCYFKHLLYLHTEII